MTEGLVQFEVEIQSLTEIRSRVIWPDSEGPWIEGGMEDLMVHFTYASWTAYNLGCAMSMALASKDENLGQAISDMMTKMISSLGAIQIAEIRLTREALDELQKRSSRTLNRQYRSKEIVDLRKARKTSKVARPGFEPR